ncbi:MAG: HAMP domain-containing histidine kinase [Cytophagaceae bacterium]|nr:HAMP domain-containing histidine kinase [Gemmatimonadaceae bacterium]
MSRSASAPSSRRLVAILVLFVVLAAALTYEAWEADHDHRYAAQQTLKDYAALAAWEYNSSTKEALYPNLMWVFGPVKSETSLPPSAKLPEPMVILRKEALEKLCKGDKPPFAFRIDARTREATFAGNAPDARIQRWIRDTVLVELQHYRMDYSYLTVTGTVDGRHLVVLFQVKWSTDDTPAAAYGTEFCLASFQVGALARVMQKYPMLPPSLTANHANDSLLSVIVKDEQGREVFRSPVQYPPTFTGTHTLQAFGYSTTVALNPRIAPQLVIGGLPPSRLPLLVGLFGMTSLLLFIGIVQLRRESELARLRSDFIASVSHELRTPLAQMRMFAETLRLGRIRNEEERERSLTIIDQESRRLAHLVENVLLFSRSERQAPRLSPRDVALANELRETVQAFTPIAEARRVTVELELEEDARAFVDPAVLRQVTLNLLDNAVKYGPDGQVVRLTLAAARHGRGAVISVEDEGPGIPTADRERIWLPYFRLRRDVDSAVAGSGIGLAVVRDLVERQGGSVWVESATPRGSRFVVELPGAGTPDGPRAGRTSDATVGAA